MNAVDAVFEQHGSRTTDFRRGHALGTRDHVVQWRKPARPEWMTKAQYEASPPHSRFERCASINAFW
jgi:hypothetical protein